MDGSSLTIANTPQVKGRMSKAATRRAKAAFARLGVAVLVELGLHNPLAASVGARGDSEMSLAEPLRARLPEKSLLIADRYYGVPKPLLRFRELYPKEDCHFLTRVRRNLRGRVLEAYADGSALVEIRSGAQTMLVRRSGDGWGAAPIRPARCGSGPVCWSGAPIRRGSCWRCMGGAGNTRVSIAS